LGLATLLEVAAYGRPDNVPEGFMLADLYQAWRLFCHRISGLISKPLNGCAECTRTLHATQLV
jgi:hypothetical protein